MPLYKREVGSNLWLWTQQNNRQGSTSLCISAHGGVAQHAPKIPFHGVTLYFYSEHGYLLNDPGLINIVYGAVKPRETVKPGVQIQDYELTKYTNTSDDRTQHNKVRETYGSVGRLPEAAADKKKLATEQLETLPAALADAIRLNVSQAPLVAAKSQYERDVKAMGRAAPLMDIVTIRDRWWRRHLTLSEVINDLLKAGLYYNHIHCNFCRGEHGTPDKTQKALPADL